MTTQKVPVIPEITNDVPLSTRRSLQAMKVTIEYLLTQVGTTQSRFGGTSVSVGGAGSASQHNSLSALQGGSTGSYFHLTETQHTDLTDGGDSTLHFHASDRALSNATGTLPWAQVDKTGATLADFGTLNHEDLDLFQGGTTGEHYHMTLVQWDAHISGADNSWHYHATDRARANHTGTQPASTISDFETAVAATPSVVLTDGTRTITGPQVISVDSADPALRVTQAGTGPALVVEDAANPDATPLVVDNEGFLGLNTVPTRNLHVHRSTSGIVTTRMTSNTRSFDIALDDSTGVATLAASVGVASTSPVSIDVSSTTAALRVTQTGAGDSLLIEDSSNPDSSPIVINADGQLVVGATTNIGTAKLQVIRDDGNSNAFNAIYAGTDNAGPTFNMLKRRGSNASPAIVAASDIVWQATCQGYDGAANRTLAQFVAMVDGTPGAGSMPGKWIFRTTPTGSTTSVDRFIVDAAGNVIALSHIVLPKTSGIGIKVDTAIPTFGWRDLLGEITTRPAAGGGAAALPDFVAYRGNVYAYRFGTTAPDNHLHEAFINYHIPHDYVPGSDLHFHIHWSQIVVDTGGTAGVPGVAKWYADISYSKGHGTAGGAADAFNAPITVSVTQQASTTQYGHMIAEVQFTNAGGTGGLIDSARIEVDGVVMVRLYRDPTDVADTLDQNTFVHYADVHYQSTNMATKQKAPNFYV